MGVVWPLTLEIDVPGTVSVRLRRLRRRDKSEWTQLRDRNRAWLGTWAATSPGPGREVSHRERVTLYDRQAHRGSLLPLAVEVDGALAGEVHLAGVLWGPVRSANVGYWIDEALAGRSIIPWCVAAVIDRGLGEMGLHRVEALICPENAASVKVAEKLGLVPEGIRRGAMCINGRWRDHCVFAVTTEDVVHGSVSSRLAYALASRSGHKVAAGEEMFLG